MSSQAMLFGLAPRVAFTRCDAMGWAAPLHYEDRLLR